MNYTEKVSISLPPTLMQFVDEYKVTHARKTCSKVIEEAVTLLHERELEGAYRQACSADSNTASAFDTTMSDGLHDEAC